jgi:D-arabinose 1-dehydrogenase-like Zn-dependent alcohol dehydrogenase
MLAVVYAGYGADPVLTQVADPDCPADGVVVAVGATGVCRSDWHAWKGRDPVTLPHIGGHEFAGVVVAAGPGVTGWHAGDRVTVPFACGCGGCEHCLAGDAQVCPRQTLPMDLVIARELEIYGSHGMAARDYPAMMRLIADGTLRPGLLVGEVIALGDVGRALAAMDGPAGAGMTVVRLAG